MRKWGPLIVIVLVVVGLFVWRGGLFGGGAGKPTITFGFTPWTITYPGTYVAKTLIEEELGYPVELEEANVGVIYSGLAKGDIDAFMDSWLPDLHRDYMAQFGDDLEDLGAIYTDAILGWGVPDFVDPGLQSIAALDEYRDLFNGEVIGIGPGAGMSRTSRRVIEAYDLNYTYVASSEAAMLTEMANAFREETPLLFLVYRPHSMFVKWPIRVLDDPRQIWKPSEVHVMANENLGEKAPEVYELLKRFEMPISDYEEWILAQDSQGADPQDLADQWIVEHPERVQHFLDRS